MRDRDIDPAILQPLFSALIHGLVACAGFTREPLRPVALCHALGPPPGTCDLVIIFDQTLEPFPGEPTDNVKPQHVVQHIWDKPSSKRLTNDSNVGSTVRKNR